MDGARGAVSADQPHGAGSAQIDVLHVILVFPCLVSSCLTLLSPIFSMLYLSCPVLSPLVLSYLV